jgi:phosphodiesterase/alkaline phosphatase D-like protein
LPAVTAGTRIRATLTATGLAAIAAFGSTASAAPDASGFKYGVATGDVRAHSAIFWAKAKRPGTAFLQLSKGGPFAPCVKDEANAVATAKKNHDATVQTKLCGLAAGAAYRYRFCRPGGARSEVGKFTTAPAPNANETIHFGLSGDQDARPAPGGKAPYWGAFEIWNRIVSERNDFNVLLGDTIYSDTEVPGYGLADIATTLKQKWRAYRTNLGQKPWVKARGSTAYYAHWDDHEFINDFSREESTFPYSNDGVALGSTQIDGNELYKRGVKAFRDYNPISYDDKSGIYRSIRWGKNLEIFFLDERSFRSASSDYSGACDNPAGSGNPDLAPTAPQSTRNVFSLVAPALSNPAPPACLASINDPKRTMLGSNQLAKFERAISTSTATFKVVFNEVPIQQFYALPYDRWEGYEAERQSLLHFLAENTNNVVFLTADVHASLVNDARFNTLGGPGVQNSGILDVTTGPIATETFSGEINKTVGSSGAGALIHDLFLKPQPPSGVGMQCAATNQESYAEVTVSKNELRIELLDEHGDRVSDTGEISSPGPPCGSIVIPRR